MNDRVAAPPVRFQDDDMELIKLIALDEEDLRVFSAHLQDAIVRTGDMTFLPKEKRFAAIVNRFDWRGAAVRSAENGSGFERRSAALRFEKVLAAQFQNLSLEYPRDALELLALQFVPAEAPEGHITLYFAGGGAIRLHVECIEAELRDLGGIWKTRLKPEHPEGAVS